MPEVSMPRLSDTMQEGTITRWLKKTGDQVKKGDIIAEVETDKANMEIEAYNAGILEQILVHEGEVAAIGQAIAIIGTGQSVQKSAQPATKSAPAAQLATANSAARATTSQPAVQVPAPISDNGTRIKVSPLARRIAEEHGIDLRLVQGSGPSGRIIRDDLEDYLEKRHAAPAVAQPVAAPLPVTPVAPAAPAPVEAVPADVDVVALTTMQKTVARRLTESKQTVPHFYISNEVDMTDLLTLRPTLNAASEGDVKISVNDLVIKACALALEKFPEVNSSYKDGQFLRHKHINIGCAVDIPNGLVVPVIRDVNLKGVRTIARETKALAEKAKAGRLTVADLSGGTFSISNLGMMDVSSFVAVINPPEAAILAVAAIRKTFVPVDGQPVIRDIMPLTLSADHRILYGAMVARFLQEVKRLLQNPYALLG
ncbi:MAG: 2-oxo acid dehydrogenase subunit E2 [Chloroflexi bacterium]|nr:MAG: 2-oxo acid dehydrogenase subunit E2 [Chloroflexota bacterium]